MTSKQDKTGHARRQRGNALLLGIIATMLLFIMGMAFLSTTMTEKVTVTNVQQRDTLDQGLDAVLQQINTTLTEDLFDENGRLLGGDGTDDSAEYYDYPGPDDPWLASTEPEALESSTPNTGSDDTYYWRHLSDLYGNGFGIPAGTWYDPLDRNDPTQWSSLEPTELYFRVNPANWVNYPRIAQENKGTEIILDQQSWSDPMSVCPWGAMADADGDGVTDARWVRIPGLRGPQGEYLYTAVRIIDNSAGLNVNIAYANDEESKGERLTELSLVGMPTPSLDYEDRLEEVKALHTDRDAMGTYVDDIPGYYDNIVLSLDSSSLGPKGMGLFDLSDELELRNRYCLDAMSNTALEYTWPSYLSNSYKQNPYDNFIAWFNNLNWRDTQEHEGTNTPDRRHFLTTYSWDRTIGGNVSGETDIEGFDRPYQDDAADPGQKVEREHGAQANINLDDAGEIAWALSHAFVDGGDADERKLIAQLACNIFDYRDGDTEPSYIHYASSGSAADTYVFGHEPQPYISKLISTIAANPTAGNNTFQVELYNPYSADINLDDFLIRIYDSAGTEKSATTLSGPLTTGTPTTETVDEFATFTGSPGTYAVDEYYIVTIVREVDIDGGTTKDVLLDKWECPDYDGTWLHWDAAPHEQTRNTSDWKVIWESDPPYNYNLDIPYPERDFRTVGEVTRVLKIGPPWLDCAGATCDVASLETVGEQLAGGTTKAEGRLNMEDEDDAVLLNYLSVLTRMDATDKNGDGQNDDSGELRFPGRININTAPRRIIAAVPWVQNLQDPPGPPMTEEDRQKLSRAIVAYRDTEDLLAEGGPDYRNRETATGITGIRTEWGFASIGELLNVTRVDGGDEFFDIRRWGKNAENDDVSGDPNEGPMFDGWPDTATDDLEERDILFHRMSNLVTVRSDVFTAYILVRLGETGPQRRVMAILDRSNVFGPTDAVRVVAVQPVPDPR